MNGVQCFFAFVLLNTEIRVYFCDPLFFLEIYKELRAIGLKENLLSKSGIITKQLFQFVNDCKTNKQTIELCIIYSNIVHSNVGNMLK